MFPLPIQVWRGRQNELLFRYPFALIITSLRRFRISMFHNIHKHSIGDIYLQEVITFQLPLNLKEYFVIPTAYAIVVTSVLDLSFIVISTIILIILNYTTIL